MGLAILWGTTWAFAGSAMITLRLWTRLSRPGLPLGLLMRVAWQSFLMFAVAGVVCGVGFSFLLAGAERRRTIDSLSIVRASAWGAIAGVVMTLGILVFGRPPLVAIGFLSSVFAGVGALSAATTVALARRAPAIGPTSESDDPLLAR